MRSEAGWATLARIVATRPGRLPWTALGARRSRERGIGDDLVRRVLTEGRVGRTMRDTGRAWIDHDVLGIGVLLGACAPAEIVTVVWLAERTAV